MSEKQLPLCCCIVCHKEFSVMGIHSHFINSHTEEGNKKCKERGRKGALISNENRKNNNIDNYNKNPKLCQECNQPIPYEKRNTNKFCCSSCAAKHTNRERNALGFQQTEEQKIVYKKQSEKCIEKITSKLITKFNESNDPKFLSKIPASGELCKLYYCKACGKLYGSHKERDNCVCTLAMKNPAFKNLNKYFGLNLDLIGTQSFVEEFERCRQHALEMYETNSLPSLACLLNHPDKSGGNLGKMFKYMNIELDSQTHAQLKSSLQGRRKLNYPEKTPFKSGWVHSEIKSYYYRSSYEEKFIYHLLNNGVIFAMEDRIPYYDSNKQIIRVAYPDFIVENKIIIEVKSNYTFNTENMVDKFKSYIEKGYEPYLQLEFEYFKLVDNSFVKLSKDFDPCQKYYAKTDIAFTSTVLKTKRIEKGNKKPRFLYTIRTPNGDIVRTNQLTNFCQEHLKCNINFKYMQQHGYVILKKEKWSWKEDLNLCESH